MCADPASGWRAGAGSSYHWRGRLRHCRRHRNGRTGAQTDGQDATGDVDLPAVLHVHQGQFHHVRRNIRRRTRGRGSR